MDLWSPTSLKDVLFVRLFVRGRLVVEKQRCNKFLVPHYPVGPFFGLQWEGARSTGPRVQNLLGNISSHAREVSFSTQLRSLFKTQATEGRPHRMFPWPQAPRQIILRGSPRGHHDAGTQHQRCGFLFFLSSNLPSLNHSLKRKT